MNVDRIYRKNLSADLETFEVKIKETDLLISVEPNRIGPEIREKIQQYTYGLRQELETYLAEDPDFQITLSPYLIYTGAPVIAQKMAKYANIAGVGPMAAVAGGFAEMVGEYVGQFSPEVIVENGGDIYLKSRKPRIVGIFAGMSPFSNRIGLKLFPRQMPLGVCTSSGTVGPSLSFGKADAAIILAKSAFLADAAATAVGNRVNSPEDFDLALACAKKIDGIHGIVIIKDDKMAAWGAVEVVPIK
ncbi:UPF0280 family protein [Candidatus Formimonas warabiya]|uniref:Uncharacterized protein n=1 Tax=Formimonas warabiya TaxID=1761012 RepID=A0A3G1KNB5_FORW1|nr:UPF0280 family protein [Candidatus Formimonas warabiya]ATW23948.1 hypothetical protein DCMF_03315 [Candidatus Formimonas warabiya]